jgi:hypothetical protein
MCVKPVTQKMDVMADFHYKVLLGKLSALQISRFSHFPSFSVFSNARATGTTRVVVMLFCLHDGVRTSVCEHHRPHHACQLLDTGLGSCGWVLELFEHGIDLFNSSIRQALVAQRRNDGAGDKPPAIHPAKNIKFP